MYYLSKICCFCLQNNVKLQHLHRITYHGFPLIDVIRIVIDDTVLSGSSHEYFTCKDCVKRVKETYTFRQTIIKNIRQIVKYVQQLRSFGGEFGSIQVRIIDVMKSTDPAVVMYKNTARIGNDVNTDVNQIEYVDCRGLLSESEIKLEPEDCDYDMSRESKDHCGDENIVFRNLLIKNEPGDVQNNITGEDAKLHGRNERTEIKKEIDDSGRSLGNEDDPTTFKTSVENNRYEKQPGTEQPEIKIEIHDDFTEMYDRVKHETNDPHPDTSRNDPKPKYPKSYKCETCGKSFSTKCNLKMHHLTHSGEKPYKCEICNKGFSQMGSLKTHGLQHTNVKSHRCDVCGKCFYVKQHLKLHSMTHTGEKPYKCETCGKPYRRQQDLKMHIFTHIPESPHVCEICGKAFSIINHLNQHKLYHVDEKPNKCDICNKSFIKAISLKNHYLSHTGEKPHTCEICGKSFTYNFTLNRHRLIHSGEKPYECTTCNKSFLLEQQLKLHSLIHCNEKPHKCGMCEKSFTLKSSLKTHVMAHTGEKPYKCKLCHKTFSRKQALNIHNLQHTGDNPYKCKTCGKSYMNLRSLKLHELEHSGQVPCRCEYCGRRFLNETTLMQHSKVHDVFKGNT